MGHFENKEPAPFVKQILLLHICPQDMLENFRQRITYMNTSVFFIWRNFALWRGKQKKTLGNPTKGSLGI
jgi:hypothetical protein